MSSSSMTSGMSPFGQNAASTIRDAREREKKEMSDLNDRLADYIEKVGTFPAAWVIVENRTFSCMQIYVHELSITLT